MMFVSFQSFLGGLFGPVCEIDVLLNDAENRKTAELKTEEGKVEKHYLFYDGESVSGKVNSGYITYKAVCRGLVRGHYIYGACCICCICHVIVCFSFKGNYFFYIYT